jgi:hypothetical protein
MNKHVASLQHTAAGKHTAAGNHKVRHNEDCVKKKHHGKTAEYI